MCVCTSPIKIDTASAHKTIKEAADNIPPGDIPRPAPDFTCGPPWGGMQGLWSPEQHPREGASEWVFAARAEQPFPPENKEEIQPSQKSEFC